MLKDRRNAAIKVAESLLAAEQAIDAALARAAELSGTMVTARTEANLSALVGHEAFEVSASAFAALARARCDIVETHKRLSETRRSRSACAPSTSAICRRKSDNPTERARAATCRRSPDASCGKAGDWPRGMVGNGLHRRMVATLRGRSPNACPCLARRGDPFVRGAGLTGSRSRGPVKSCLSTPSSISSVLSPAAPMRSARRRAGTFGAAIISIGSVAHLSGHVECRHELSFGRIGRAHHRSWSASPPS